MQGCPCSMQLSGARQRPCMLMCRSPCVHASSCIHVDGRLPSVQLTGHSAWLPPPPSPPGAEGGNASVPPAESSRVMGEQSGTATGKMNQAYISAPLPFHPDPTIIRRERRGLSMRSKEESGVNSEDGVTEFSMFQDTQHMHGMYPVSTHASHMYTCITCSHMKVGM